jgi:hypothetical protein
MESHRQVPGCWREKQDRLSIDLKSLSVLRQGGSGHGQTLELDEIAPRKDGGLTVRRLAYAAPTPYRPKVKEESTGVEEVVLDAEEARALGELLDVAMTLRQFCSKQQEPGRTRWSSASFSLRFRVESAGKVLWRCSYTGYPGSSGENQYTHGVLVDQVLRAALARRTWEASKITADDRRRLLRWSEENFEREEWWVRERYLRMALTAGDESFLPFLRKAAKDLRGKEDPSEVRQQGYVREALRRIAGVDE